MEGKVMLKQGNAIFFACISLLAFSYLRDLIPVDNMPFYLLACLLFIGVFLMIYYKVHLPESISTYGSLLLLAAIILFDLLELKVEHPIHDAYIPRHDMPGGVWLLIVVAGVLICLLILRSGLKIKNQTFRDSIRICFLVIFSIAVGIQFYTPNILEDVQGNIFHSHAYTNSILNVCFLTPYSHEMTTYYGHYGILYMPFVKLLHRFFAVDYLTGICLVSAVIAGLSIFAYGLLVHRLTKRDLVFYLALLAVGEEYFMLMTGGVYLQVHPHRMIFPILIALWAYFEIYSVKNAAWKDLIAIALLTLSFVWSTEVGLVTMMAFCVYRYLFQIWDGEKFSFHKVLLFIKPVLLFIVVPFAAGYVFVNGYNLFVGGSMLSFREFMYPVISDKGYVLDVQLPLPKGVHAWTLACGMFLTVFCICGTTILSGRRRLDNRREKNLLFTALLSVTGLGLMMYYINRPVENSMAIVLFMALLVIVNNLENAADDIFLLKESGITIWKKNCAKCSMILVSVLVLFVMAFDGVYSMPNAYLVSKETIWNKQKLDEFAEHIYWAVPPDAPCFGMGVPEIMSVIERDPVIHTTDFSYPNMELDVMEKIRYDLENYEWFFCNTQSLWEMQNHFPGLTDQYVLWDEFHYGNYEFGFFKRIEE